MRKRTENQRRRFRLFDANGVPRSQLDSFPNSTPCERKPGEMISEDYSRSDNIIKSFNWVLSCLSYLWSRFYNRFIDPFVWMFTGERCAIRLSSREDACHASPLQQQLLSQNNDDHPEHDPEGEQLPGGLLVRFCQRVDAQSASSARKVRRRFCNADLLQGSRSSLWRSLFQRHVTLSLFSHSQLPRQREHLLPPAPRNQRGAAGHRRSEEHAVCRCTLSSRTGMTARTKTTRRCCCSSGATSNPTR